MEKDDLPTLAGRVLMALMFALGFSMSFLWPYSPERLLAQCLLAMLVIDGLRCAP